MTDVLLVEDEPLVRLVLQETLQDAGLSVTEAASADEALERPNGADVPRVVVYVTGRPVNIEGRDFGPRERLLLKPFACTDLVRTVRGLIGPEERSPLAT